MAGDMRRDFALGEETREAAGESDERLTTSDSSSSTAEVAPEVLAPGAMEVELRRELPDGGVIEFASAPIGYPKADGEPRRKPYREYHYVWPDLRRVRLISVTTLLDGILPNGGLPRWYEEKGIEGARKALSGALVTVEQPGPEWVSVVRREGLGGDAARDSRGGEGLAIHAILEGYMRTGEMSSTTEIPDSQRGYFQSLCSWLLLRDPEPVRVEEMVADPAAGYAGRSDLVARIGGRLVRVDFKTQRRGLVFPKAHYQAALYEAAALCCGDEPCDDLTLVAFPEDGGDANEMPCLIHPENASVALHFSALTRPVDAACAARNRQR